VRSRGACRSCILPPSARCLNPVPTRFPELSPAFPSDSRPTGSRRKRLRPPSSRGLSRVHCPRFRCEFLRASQPRYVPPVELPVNGSGLIFRRTRSQFPACPLLFVFVFLARSLSWSLTLLPCSPPMPFLSPLSPTLCPAPLYPSPTPLLLSVGYFCRGTPALNRIRSRRSFFRGADRVIVSSLPPTALPIIDRGAIYSLLFRLLQPGIPFRRFPVLQLPSPLRAFSSALFAIRLIRPIHPLRDSRRHRRVSNSSRPGSAPIRRLH
jgi:hypothetical protein